MKDHQAAHERKEEILDIAEELFNTQGFENTSISHILKRAQIARGTLYYHFASKEDILDAVVQRQGTVYFAQARAVAQSGSMPAPERLVATILTMMSSGEKEHEELEHVHAPHNALMHQKINRIILKEATPILSEIIRQGIEEGVFVTPYPEQSVEMILIYANVAFDYEADDREKAERVQGFLYNLNRLLGCDEGTLDFSGLFINPVEEV